MPSGQEFGSSDPGLHTAFGIRVPLCARLAPRHLCGTLHTGTLGTLDFRCGHHGGSDNRERACVVVAAHGLDHGVRHGVDEARMIVDRTRTRHRQPDFTADVRRLDVEIVEHLDVIAQEPDRAEHGGAQALAVLLPQIIADVGPEPRVFRAAAAALIDERAVACVPGGRQSRRPTLRRCRR